MSEMRQDVEEAIVAVQAGHTEAYARVVEAHHRQLRAAVAGRCPPGLDADDIAQQAFINVYAKIDQYKPGTNFSAWLWVVARHILLTEIRKLKRRGQRDARYIDRVVVQRMEKDLSGETLAGTDHVLALRECVAILSEKTRAVLNMRYEKNEPIRQIAEKLGRSVTALKVQLFTIRKTLRQCVKRKLNTVRL